MKKVTLIPLLFLALTAGCRQADQAFNPNAATGTVTIEIVGKTKTHRIDIADVAQGTSLEHVMRSIDKVPIKLNGSGKTAFVDKIGDQGTDATGGWTFTVDGEHANQGIGNTWLFPPTKVTWRFGDM